MPTKCQVSQRFDHTGTLLARDKAIGSERNQCSGSTTGMNHNKTKLDEATYLKPTVMFGSKTIQFRTHSPLPLNREQPFPFQMSYSRRPKAGGRRKRLTDTSIAASGAGGVESTEFVSNKTGEGVHASLNRAIPKSCSRWPDTTVVDQRSARAETTDSEMSIADAVNEDCDSDTSTATNPNMQRGSGDSGKGLDGVAPFVERNPDNVASTLEWGGRVLHSQEATQVTASGIRPRSAGVHHWSSKLSKYDNTIKSRREFWRGRS